MLPKTPPKLLLLDGIGAMVTAGSMALVLAPLEPLFGLPRATAYGLALLGALFASYSLSGALSEPKRSRTRLRNIAIANLGYCALSLGLMIHHKSELTPLGRVYLGAEIAIVALLSKYELKVAKLVAKR